MIGAPVRVAWLMLIGGSLPAFGAIQEVAPIINEPVHTQFAQVQSGLNVPTADDFYLRGHEALNVGDFKAAEAHFKRELALRLDPGFRSPRQMALMNLATAIESQERWHDAEQYLRVALQEAGPYASEDRSLIGQLGLNLRAQGRHAEAVPFLLEARNQRSAVADSLEMLGRFVEAESVWRAIGNEDAYARLAANLRRQGKDEAALSLDEKAFADKTHAEALDATSVEELRRSANVFRQTADYLRKEGKAEAAAAVSDQATMIEAQLDPSPEAQKRVSEIRQRQSEALAKALRDEAEGSGDTERLKKLQEYEQALKSMQQRGPTPFGWTGFEHTEVSVKRAELAIKQAAAGRYTQAEQGLSEACPKLLSRSIVDLSRPPAWFPKRKVLTAAECFTELALVRLRQIPEPGDSIDAMAFEAAQFATLTEAASAITTSSARDFARRNGAGSIVDQIGTQLRAIEQPGLELMPSLLKAMETSESKNGPPIEVAIILDKLTKATHTPSLVINDLVDELSRKLPAYFELRLPQPLPISALQSRHGPDSALLNEDEAIVLWMMPPDSRHGLVFAISKSKSAWARMSMTGTEIAERVGLLRRQIDPCAFGRNAANCNTGGQEFSRRTAWELHQALLGSSAIQSVISPESIKTLMIVPSGVLTTLPPAMLITKEPKGDATGDEQPEAWAASEWLIANKALAMLPSISVLRTLRAKPLPVLPITGETQPARLFMLADPAYNGDQRTNVACTRRPRAVSGQISAFGGSQAARRKAVASLPRLPCTREEAMQLKDILGGQVLLGTDARESALRNQASLASLANAEIVAFSTHGIVAGEIGVGEPALALSAPLPHEKDDDGLLTASEIVNMKMRADLILLSACNTASPDADDANGLSGLSRAFFFAGARSVLASHWRVDDATSAQLIVDTVRYRATKLPKAQALRESSLAMLKRARENLNENGNLAHPSSWAPFTLIGDPR